jgi:phosphonate transport system substrate-binding protein
MFAGAPCSLAADGDRALVIGHREKVGKAGSRSFTAIAAHLESELGRKIEFRAFDDADILYDSFRSGRVDAAFIGPVYYVRAHKEMKAVPLVAEGTSYHSVIIVPKNSPLKKIEDLRGKRLALGYKDSTSSHYFPLLMLSKARVKETELAAMEFVGSHRKVVDVVIDGKFDAGGVIESEFQRNQDRGLRALAVSEPIPGVPVIVRPDFDPKLAEQIRKAFLSFKPAQSNPEEAFTGGVVPIDDKAYNQIRFLCKVLFGKDYS